MVDEFARIRRWTEGRQSAEWQRERGVVIGIGDDAAVLEPPGEGRLQWVMAVDTMVETVHFNSATMDEPDIGWKALAANVSDLAAMGAVPRYALVSVSVPPSYGPERMRRLYDGLYACADRYGVAVVGGDTTSSPGGLVVAVTAAGTVEPGRALRRSGAQPGDAVFVTGPVGMAAAGLHWLTAAGAAGAAGGRGAGPAGSGPAAEARAGSDMAGGGAGPVPESLAEASGVAALVRAHRRPAPSPAAGRLLAARGSCRSLNDVSDGLASEAWELAEASGVALALRAEALPLSGSLASYASAAGVDPFDWMLYGGEDYVLIGTIDPADAEGAKAACAAQGLPFYVIGSVEPGPPDVRLETGSRGKRVAVPKRGYNHFTDSEGDTHDD